MVCFLLVQFAIINYSYWENLNFYFWPVFTPFIFIYRLSILCKDETKLKIALMMETQRQEEIKKVLYENSYYIVFTECQIKLYEIISLLCRYFYSEISKAVLTKGLPSRQS